MAQPGPSDYRATQHDIGGGAHAEGVLDQATQRAQTMAEELVAALKERPYVTLAVTAGLAFAVGAVWKLGHRRPQTRLDALRAQLPDVRSRMPELPSWNGLVDRWWR